ncbi:hypothetical protein [Pseudogulbenkiania sp. MAI-1]|uniref:hypothetical protein n=1 Tax=Pseudogulbenkiania sp. MAI-1 TaxID=990370 RepID=UPI00045EAEA0|nr:hypothetical protein [Pseudogulbenkiania sp. MAI-1]
MAIQPLPFTGRQDGATPNQRMALDNLIRRELKVGDPSDPEQVARALLERYQGEPRARGLAQEAAGLPFLQVQLSTPAALPTPTATSVDLQQAVQDVHQDLEHLTHSNLLKDVQPELAGWAQSIRSAVAEGTQAARYGMDTQQRDKAFAIRRQLSDYARMARLIGALTPAVNYDYRNLAQSLDEVSAVILVLMGEALANTGLAGGRFMLQAPYSELQVRRDAVLHALRNLVGATQETYGPNDWPRGLDAYRRLYDTLEVQGQGDLRSLLTENELMRVMDEVIERTGQGAAEGLRAAGSTAQIDLHRFSRLVAIGSGLVKPESPPLASFLQALSLFADAFKPAGGFRLLRVARPSILFYGLYGAGEEHKAERRLTQLVLQRGVLASQLDCLMRCNCDKPDVLMQIALDKVLYVVDRAIDLYSVGNRDFALPEARAAAYSYVVDAILNHTQLLLPPPEVGERVWTLPGEINESMQALRQLLRPFDRTTGGKKVMLWDTTENEYKAYLDERKLLPGKIYLRVLMENELRLQHDVDTRWRSLVDGMASGCVPSDEIFGPSGVLTRVTQVAINLVNDEDPMRKLDETPSLQPHIPAHFETSLSALLFNHGPDGEGRDWGSNGD